MWVVTTVITHHPPRPRTLDPKQLTFRFFVRTSYPVILPLPGAGATGSQYTSISEDDTLLAHTLDGASEGSENTQP